MNPEEVSSILNMDLTSVDDSFPLIKDKTVVACRVSACSLADTKSGGSQIKVTLETLTPTQDKKGQPLPAGFKLFDQLSITPTDKNTIESIMPRIKRLRKGLSGNGSGPFGDPAQYVGNEVFAEIGIQVDKDGQYPDKNVIRKYIPKA